MDLGPYGGAETFIADINGDGQPEFLTYQGPGVLGARMFRRVPQYRTLLPESTCVSAFSLQGRRLWTWGEPNAPERPYLSHAYESCVSVGDADGDGHDEVAVAIGDGVVLLDGATGKLKRSCSLPEDYYYQVRILDDRTADHEAAVVVKNGEFGSEKEFKGPDDAAPIKPYDASWPYGQPVIGLNTRLEPAWGPKLIAGAGHHILTMDMDEDGRRDYLIGYCAVRPDGNIIWMVDAINPEKLNAFSQHVDYSDWIKLPDGKRLFAMAGSDRAYLVAEGGKTIMAMPDIHVQGCALGRFCGGNEDQAAFYNAPNGPIALYTLDGKPLTRRPAARNWPAPFPPYCRPSDRTVFHRNRPILTLHGMDRDWIGYADGGWPWAMDGNGNIGVQFPLPDNPDLPDVNSIPAGLARRRDDIGFGFAMKTFEHQGHKIIIYNRRHVWGYDLNA